MLVILLVPMQETPNCNVQEFGSHPSPSCLHHHQTTIKEAPDDANDEPGPFEEIYLNVKIDDLRIALKYVRSLQNASLDDRGVVLTSMVSIGYGIHLRMFSGWMETRISRPQSSCTLDSLMPIAIMTWPITSSWSKILPTAAVF